MAVPLAAAVARDGDGHGDDGGKDVRWGRHEQGLHARELKRGHERGDKGRHRRRRGLGDDDGGQQPDLVVGDGEADAAQQGAPLLVLAAAVPVQAVLGNGFLLLRQPPRRGREVGEEKDGAQREKYRRGPFNDEEPLPGVEAAGAVEAVLHASADEAAKGAG